MLRKILFLTVLTSALIQTSYSQVSTCNIPQINAAMAGAGFQPLNVQGYPCALYFYNPNATNNWNTAQSQAAAVGATLLTVCSLAENNAVWNAAVAAGVSGGLWIGYSDQINEGSWVWIDGGTCNFTNWNSGEPNNSSCFPSTDGEDGAIIQMSNGLWNDVYLGPTGFCLAPASYASLVKVNLCPQVTPAVSAQNVCQGDPVQLTATTIFGTGPYSYSWFNASNNLLGTGSPFVFNPQNNSTLTAVVTDQFGCTDTETINVTTQNCNSPLADICCPYDGWDYVTPITFTNNTPFATSGNLQTHLTLNTQVPISQGKMLANGNDIRFIEGFCSNVVQHYIESGINTPQTNVWVRLPSIPPNSSLTVFLKYGNPTAPSVSVPFTGGANSMFPNVLTVTGSQNLGGTQTYDWINIPVGTTITTNNSQAVNLVARKIIFNGTFNGNARGYGPQAGPGAGGPGNGSVGGGGGGYGGTGGDGGNPNGGLTYGTSNGADIDFGSGGGSSDCPATARGGGSITLSGSILEVNGTINAEGETITNQCCCGSSSEAAGAGAGGGIMLSADQIAGSGTINAKGGKGQDSDEKEGGGGGGGGRIKFFYTQSNLFTGSTQVNGGAAGTGGQSGMEPGQDGTFYAGIIPGTSVTLGNETPVSIPTTLFSSADVCENNPSIFTDQTTIESGGSISTWQWNFGDGVGTSSLQNPSYNYTSPGQYDVILIVTTSTGCTDTLEQSLTVNPGITANFTAQNVCLGDPILFSDQSSASGSSWNWNYGDNNTATIENPTHTYANSGTYSVTLTVTTSNGCSDDYTADVIVYNLPTVNAGTDLVICQGDAVTLSGSGAETYVWSPASVANGQSFNPLTTGNYTVTGTNANGCEDTDLVSVTVLPVPSAQFSSTPTTGFTGDIFTLTNTSLNATNYVWNFGNGESVASSSNSNQTIDYTTAGTYNVLLTASNGVCEDTAVIQIIVLKKEVEIFIPNVFTVNNDGTNDTWTITISNASSGKILVLNRWGNVLVTLGLNEGWDGTVNGTEATDGVYFYQYEVEDNFGEVFSGQGNFTLIRSY